MNHEPMHCIELTDGQVSYLRILIAGDVADRTCELRLLHDPNDAARFSNMRADAEKARNTGSEILGKLPPKNVAATDSLDIPLFLRRNHVK